MSDPLDAAKSAQAAGTNGNGHLSAAAQARLDELVCPEKQIALINEIATRARGSIDQWYRK